MNRLGVVCLAVGCMATSHSVARRMNKNDLAFLMLANVKKSLQIPRETFSLTDSQGVPLDHKLAAIMNFKNGTFIEVGAYDGIVQSNTYLFEKFYGWTGILIEPSQSLFARLCANRPNSKCFSCALGSFKENGTYAYGNFNDGPMSSFVRPGHPHNQRVLVRSLQSILDECGLQHIHFFSLDVEGYELQVLRGIDFNKTTFDYLLVEINFDFYKYSEVESLLSQNGYAAVGCFSNYNYHDNPGWSGNHNDYLFKRRSLENAQ